MKIGQDWVDVTDNLVDGQVIQIEASVAMLYIEKATRPLYADEEEALRITNRQFLNFKEPSDGRRVWMKNYGLGSGHVRVGVA